MTRRDEVEARIAQINPGADDVLCFIWARDECLLLADEVDAEREIVTKLLAMLRPDPHKTKCNCDDCRLRRATELRAVYERAYFAALGGMPRVGMESNINITGLVKEAHGYALETVRQWPAMMAELEQEIAK